MIACLLGALLLWAAVYKSFYPLQTQKLLTAVVPSLSHQGVIAAIALCELALGVGLIAGVRQRLVLGAFIILISMFSAVLFRARLSGFEGSCGCLGLTGTVGGALVRNGGLILLAMFAFFAPSSGAVSLTKE